ncbi:GNAT family N-acetyltransferase [Marinoscillum furvescens]|uniref:RimJ/RimL family protein N-acetyltransferase n=1 Tax=Marinoscillum furvescens DSM 4134 TaxID=1122208 RepID=A0A3D9KXD6_MARFU|nr:GNAT family N-acetyltransferase [Marinoscillum furvescens]RED92315.1 RimJ/RimL family protein N-acetyltransferase [Marinoscillum furvescens DSM 4134]
MIITGNRISLERITADDLELLRSWRNKPEIRSQMEYQQHISAEAQKQWFDSLDPKLNYFFKISYASEAIGLIQIQNLNTSTHTADSGLYIAKPSFWRTPIPYLASLPLLDLAFNFLKIKTLTAKVKKTNEAALNYNRSLGYHSQTDTNSSFTRLVCTRESFLATANHPHFLRFQQSYQATGLAANQEGLFISATIPES